MGVPRRSAAKKGRGSPRPFWGRCRRSTNALASAPQAPPGLLVDLAGDPQPLIALESARCPAGLFLTVAVHVVPAQIARPVQQTLDFPAIANAAFRLLNRRAGVGAHRAALVQFAERADRGRLAFLLLTFGAVPHHVALAVLVAHLALPIIDGIAHGGGLAEDRCLAGGLNLFRLAAVLAAPLRVDRHGQQRGDEQGERHARSPTDSVPHAKLPRTLRPGRSR